MSNYLTEERRLKSWSFCIAFGGDTKNLHKVIDSIRALNIPFYEILIAEERLTLKSSGDTRIIESGSDREGWITKKKNMMIKEAKYENICLLHDYIQFKPDWYEAYCNFQEDWNICSNQIYNPFRSARVADWMTLDHPKYGVSLLPYEERGQSKYMFLSGLYFLVKKTFILKNNLFIDAKLIF